MNALQEFFSREAGQRRRAALDGAISNALSYYLGPTGMVPAIEGLNYLNPVRDIEQAGLNAQRVAGGDAGAIVPMITDMASVLAPAGAVKIAGGTAANALAEGVLGFGGPTREGLQDAARRFAADESGALTLPGRGGDVAEERAQSILDLLTSGRASEVTDEMLDLGDPVQNARLSMYLFDNYDLPMDEASRMARAGEMGFDTPAYHGTGAGGFSEFRGDQTFGATDPADANVYARYGDAGQVYPITMRADNPERFDLMTWDPQREAGVFDRAREAGHDAYYATDGRRIAFDPRNIRSRFARFDPRLSHLRNLSAGLAGAAVLTDEGRAEIESFLSEHGY